MKEYTKSNHTSRILSSSPRASKQASISVILQSYKDNILRKQPVGSQKTQPRNLMYNEVREVVAQCRLVDDLMNGTKKRAIAGEIHNEIDPVEECSKWKGKNRNIKVIYESDELPGTHKRPDPGILRLFYGWSMFFDHLNLLRLIAEERKEKDVSMEPFHYLFQVIVDEINIINPSVDILLLDIYHGILELKGNFPTQEKWENYKWFEQIVISKSLVRKAEKIDGEMHNLYGRNYYTGSMDSDYLCTQRSREMLKNINASTHSKLIYKVGDAHISDMKGFHVLKPSGEVVILSKDEYIPEYEALL